MIQSYGGGRDDSRFAPELPSSESVAPHRGARAEVLRTFPGDVLTRSSATIIRSCSERCTTLACASSTRVDQGDPPRPRASAGRGLPFHASREEQRGVSPRPMACTGSGVRLDHPRELEKIVAATGNAPDLELFVRLTVPGDGRFWPSPASSAPARSRRSSSCAGRRDWRRRPGSPSMSARNASPLRPMSVPSASRPRWRMKPAASTISMWAAAFRPPTQVTSRLRRLRRADRAGRPPPRHGVRAPV